MLNNLSNNSQIIENRLQNWFEEITTQYNLDLATWQFSLTDQKVCLASLSQAEQTVFKSFNSEKRKIEWLIGRKALSEILSQEERISLRFPNPVISLSHSGNLAIAFKALTFCGVGVDLQVQREIKNNIAAKFLSEAEVNNFAKKDLLELWCIKEALFKANIHNEGTFLKDYLITSIDSLNNGSGSWEKKEFAFTCFDLNSYLIAFAVCMG